MAKIKDWSSHIVRHFWYCTSECHKDESISDAEALKLMKVFNILDTDFLILLANEKHN